MLLFEPYSSEDIESIIEEKKNKLYKKCVPLQQSCNTTEEQEERKTLSTIFHGLVDEKAM